MVSFCFFDWFFISLKFYFFFNSILFSFVLLLVSVTVFVYSCYYLDGEVNFFYYFFVLCLFIFSIFFLVFRNGIFSLLVSWDLLGITSFFLVLFYNNWDSCNGSMNTVITNRIGDFFIFIFFSLSFFSGYYFSTFSFCCFSFCCFLFLAAFTKRAQFPFSGWLPKAISAPTPVSSLVHSRTLVTAGFVLLVNYNFIICSSYLMSFVLLSGVFTLFYAGVSAIFEEDLKKVVALSTLSQIGFAMITVGLGFSYLGFIHLLSHALFKSCLFIQVGYIIHCRFGQQDGRNYVNVGSFPFFIQLQLLVTLFCLCGLFFFSGFVRKDFILEMFFMNFYCFIFCCLFFLGVFFTFCYSYRIWSSFFSFFNSSFVYFSGSIIINFLSLFLVFFSVFYIWWLSFNILSIPCFFLYVDFFVPLFFVFLFVFIFRFCFKLVFFELSYKFLVDYFPKLFVIFSKNNKVFEFFLNSFFYKIFSFFNLSRFFLFRNLKSLGFNSVVIFVFLVLFLIWSISII